MSSWSPPGHQPGEVVVEPGGEHNPHHRGPESLAQRAEEVGCRRGRPQVGVGDDVLHRHQQHLHDGPHPAAHREQKSHGRQCRCLGAEGGHQPDPQREHPSPDDRHRLVAPGAGEHLPAAHRGEQHPQHHGHQQEPRPGGVDIGDCLEEERTEDARAEHDRAGDELDGTGDVEQPKPEQPGRQDGLGCPLLLGDEQSDTADARRQQCNRRGRHPVPGVAPQLHGQDDGDHPPQQQARTGVVHPGLPAGEGQLEMGDRHHQGDRPERQHHEKDPSPVGVIHQQASGQRPQDGGQSEDAAHVPLVPAPFPGRQHVGQNGHRQREQPAGAETLDGPEHNQHGHAARHPGQHRAGHEDDDGGLEETLAPPQVRELPPQRRG